MSNVAEEASIRGAITRLGRRRGWRSSDVGKNGSIRASFESFSRSPLLA